VNAIKIGIVIATPFVVGSIGGGKLAEVAGLDGWPATGVKLGVGIAAYILVANLLR